MRDRDHHEAVAELFREDPELAAEYLSAILVDGDPAELLVALRQLALAIGGVRALAQASELNANQLYRTLSPQGNPELRTLGALLEAFGLRLAVQVIQRDGSARRRRNRKSGAAKPQRVASVPVREP